MSKAIVAGVATMALAGTAMAADHAIQTHVMNVALPDGSVAKVHYVGDQAPRIAVVPVAAMVPVAMVDPFAGFERMFAAMDAQADAMMRHAAMVSQMPAANAQLNQAAIKKLPAGTVSYSYVSTTSSNGCTQTVRMTSTGGDQQPQVIRTSAGKCDAAAKPMQAVATDQQKPMPVTAAEVRAPAKPAPDATI
ncbi:MAG: hypothetical protein ACTHMG_16715 [Sphingomonas sp.]